MARNDDFIMTEFNERLYLTIYHDELQFYHYRKTRSSESRTVDKGLGLCTRRGQASRTESKGEISVCHRAKTIH